MMWLEAMDTGASKYNLQRRLGPVMQLWREQGIPNESFTREQQEEYTAQRGANTRPAVLTISWHHYLLARENIGDQEENEIVGEQSSAGLSFTPVVSWIDEHPIEGTATAATSATIASTSVAPAIASASAAADLPSSAPGPQPTSDP
jgi:hypothetical protein